MIRPLGGEARQSSVPLRSSYCISCNHKSAFNRRLSRLHWRKSIIVGWDAQKKYWKELNKLFAQRSVAMTDQHIHVNGNLGWEMAQETGEGKLKDGAPFKVDFIVTNVYE